MEEAIKTPQRYNSALLSKNLAIALLQFLAMGHNGITPIQHNIYFVYPKYIMRNLSQQLMT
ncbi:MAG: hypothetical protein AAF298_18755 [Cyanobacteria bacterium P01_A01_bin.40]